MTIRENPDADQALDEIARLVRAGDPAQARRLCERVLAQSPEDADVLIWLAQIAMDDALWAEAIAAFDRALRIRLDPWSLGNLAMCYCRTGRLTEAEHCLRGALGLKPDLVRAHVNLAAVLHGLRRFDDALAQLATAFALDATDYQIAMRQGNALTELGRFDDAQAAYAHAARLAGKFVYPRIVAFDRTTLGEITSRPRAIAPPRMLDDIDRPLDYRYVVLISCDPAYLRKHGFAFIRSFAEHAQGGNLLHVHVYDADDPLIDETREVARQAGLVRIAMSTEKCPFPRSEPQQRKSYYACGRLLHLPYWLNHYQRPLLSLDVDVIVKGRLDSLVGAATGGDLALNLREPIDSPWLDVIANIIIAKPTAAARRYLEAVGQYALRYIEREREAWLVDQTALFCVLKMMARFGEPPTVAWIAESQHPCLWHYGGANEHSAGDPRYLKYAGQ
jgi:Tfp pilus assembly protein PilF